MSHQPTLLHDETSAEQATRGGEIPEWAGIVGLFDLAAA